MDALPGGGPRPLLAEFDPTWRRSSHVRASFRPRIGTLTFTVNVDDSSCLTSRLPVVSTRSTVNF